ncbi:DUF72 domain-containing protein [Pseudonocardia xishanensis]|uniref:DUF72 domain-containing protein n=1 Tax=Pseudonocardia xishanensis TaxID=630995 RepID=A0ABP8RVF3_9PSEU
MATWRTGTSGWRYPPWRGVFYPEGLAQRRELEYLSRAVSSIEINGSFYSIQTAWPSWRDQTPEDFLFSVKGPRFVTHMKQLNDVRVPVANFLASGPLALGPKLGPILWQLPPRMIFRPDRMRAFLELLPHTTSAAAELGREHDERIEHPMLETEDRPLRHTVEVRHESFRDPAFLDLLREHGVGLVVADTAGKWPFLTEVTADFVYCRLHGAEELYVSGYTPEALDAWADRVRGWLDRDLDVLVYFDNDVKVHAPRDAIALADRLRTR